MKIRALFVIVLLVASCAVAYPYISEAWPFDKLDARSNLVVIAHAVAVEDVARVPPGRLWEGAPAITVVRTTFEPELVLRGKVQGKTFTVVHHRVTSELDQDARGIHMCCDPADFYTEFPIKKAFLMFLVQAKEGHYVPVTGANEESKAVWPLAQH